MIIIAQETVITAEHIPPKYHSACEPITLEYNHESKRLNDAMEEFENKFIAQMIERCGSREAAAVQLDISLSSLTRRIRRLRRSKLTLINEG